MPPTVGYTKYPLPGNSYGLGKLPPIRRKKMERRLTCIGRVWIFLILGVILIVLGLVSLGVYLNMSKMTTSTAYIQVMPPLVNCAAILLSGLCVCTLFWRRLKVLVLIVVVVCIACGLLCGTTAILNTTHVLQPIQSFTNCRYYLSQTLCQCFSPYKRDMLSLDFSENDLTKYDFLGAGSCTSIQETLPQLLYVVVAVYGTVLLMSIGSAIIALLVLRIETNKRSCFQDENYEEVYTVSGSSSRDHSDSELEVIGTSQDQSQGLQPSSGKNPSQRGSNTDTINSNRSGIPSINSNRSGTQSGIVGRSTTSSQSSLPQVTNTKTLTGQRSRTPAVPNDLGRESLANRYMISEIPDREVTFRHRVSKTPDRELGTRRRNSANLSKRLSKSCDSLESSERDNSNIQGLWDTGTDPLKGKGKLKAHRRKGKRAATVHTLDRDQLLLILGLQMRYLQETQETQETRQHNTQARTSSRRALTPQPSSQKAVIPQKVRSHTPQPNRPNQREKDPKEKEFYDQIETLLFRSKQKEKQRLTHQTPSGWGKRTRNLSDTSNSNTNILNGNLNGAVTNQRTINSDELIGKHSKFYTGSESYLTSQQIYKSSPPTSSGHTPYVGPSYNSADSVHYITYADTMLSKQSRKPKSRASVQTCTLPPEPLHRGSQSKHQLPPQPLSRHYHVNQPLPPQPIHRGQSAFQIVDRSSKSRSPSVCSDRNEFNTPTPRGVRTDQGDIAIRENFQMNPSPFMLQHSQERTRNPSKSVNSGNPNHLERRGQTPPTEVLPPYSGPPSYHEYVSSCEHSLTSSLSSNPDDIYSMPKRRVQQENEMTNQGYAQRMPTNQKQNFMLNSPMTTVAGEHIYGNAETFQQGPNPLTTMAERTVKPGESYYSSPSRSRVKQFIVPEDYYTPIQKIKQQKEPRSKAHNKYGRATMSPKGHRVSANRVQGQDPDYGNVGQRSNGGFSHTMDHQIAPHANGGFSHTMDHQIAPHANVGFSHTMDHQIAPSSNGGFSHTMDHQIAPDAKYHEYEDVYEPVGPQMSSGLHDNTGHPTARYQPGDPGSLKQQQPHSLNSHGFETPNSRRKPKKKSKEKSPVKSKPGYNVCNVTAKVYNVLDESGVHEQVSQSVQNVHAENMMSVPKIKVNSVDADDEDNDDDDVFTDGNVYESSFQVIQGHPATTRSNYSNTTDTQNSRKIPDYHSQQVEYRYHDNPPNQLLGPESQVKSTGVNDINDNVEESETGYMKMTLPTNLKSGVAPRANENEGFSHMAGGLANQSGEMTEREVPDGNEAESESRSESECEETGV